MSGKWHLFSLFASETEAHVYPVVMETPKTAHVITARLPLPVYPWTVFRLHGIEGVFLISFRQEELLSQMLVLRKGRGPLEYASERCCHASAVPTRLSCILLPCFLFANKASPPAPPPAPPPPHHPYATYAQKKETSVSTYYPLIIAAETATLPSRHPTGYTRASLGRSLQ